MNTTLSRATPDLLQAEWVTFPGGELEGRKPRALCATCRARVNQAGTSRHPASGTLNAAARSVLCFHCYRTELERERALRVAATIDTASDERFQFVLPLEPVNSARLVRLRLERRLARATGQAGAGRYADKRRHAQIEARRALQRIAEGVRHQGDEERNRVLAAAQHAAELQLPDAWLPFVAAR
jgi:hypothetical protein